MNDLKITPGPWFIHDETCWNELREKYVGTFDIRTNPEGNPNADSLWIADVKPYGMRGFTDRETAKANAKLIAAAPDLLDAAQYAIKCIDCLGDIGDNGNHALQVLKEAINKATK
jgi:hypothetical protein